ncbi:protein Niban 1a isoform X2 [Cynoglossus semilaevis]|uniref:protein Niban 1a isoform X2 n=1 Tax=Cynoglossus semilaevis TaxID=244447 RepID=UPI000497BDE2|nr:protein Niban-like isoform X2 [Cynoglossus semilaevis]
MGVSASSLLDENKSNYIKGQAEAELKEFSPYYRKQFSVSRFSQLEDELEQHKPKITQLLKQRVAPQEAEVLYEESLFYFDDTRKWKERYVVVRANYCLECHEGLETYMKGVPPHHKLLPTGGSVLTTEEKYMAMVDKCFPDDTNVKEDFAPPLTGMPGQFPVYLRLPYRRDSYFCFRQQAKQEAFLSIMSDCIRHQNQDFLKKKTCEVQAFLKAIQLYRQDKDKYEAWDMLIGSDVRVMANMVMEKLLPSLEKEMLPRLKAKKTEKKRVWFATVEAAYILVQEHLLDGLSALKEECRTTLRQQEVLIHSDMDQIINTRQDLEEKIRAKVSEPAEKLCSESVQPYLASVLEELMEPISSGFQEGRQLSNNMMDGCQQVVAGGDREELKKVLAAMSRPDLHLVYQRMSSLQEKLQKLQERFGFSSITEVIHRAQIDLQLLMENAASTYEQLLIKVLEDNPENVSLALEKAKHRVLKQYDYDSSTVRKRIFQEALVSITLPFIKKNLAPTCKTELQGLDQSIDPDHSNFIQVENIYESILLQTLHKEVTKVVKEAASLKKYNLFTDSRDLVSQSSRSSLYSLSTPVPGSPNMAVSSPSTPSSPPLLVNGLSSTPQKERKNGSVQSQNLMDLIVQTPQMVQTVVTETSPGTADSGGPNWTQKSSVKNVVSEEEVSSVSATEKLEVEPERGTHRTEPVEEAGSETTAAALEGLKTEAEPEVPAVNPVPSSETEPEVPAVNPVPFSKTEPDVPAENPELTSETEPEVPTVNPVPSNDTEPTSAVEGGSQAEDRSEAPSSGEKAVVTPVDEGVEDDPNSVDVSLGSESPPSDVKSEEVKDTPEEVSTTSDVLEDEGGISKTAVTSDYAPEDIPPQNPGSKTEDVGVSDDAETGVSIISPESVPEETPSSPTARPLDCVKDIRDLVVEVIDVEELVQHYPSGIPQEE